MQWKTIGQIESEKLGRQNRPDYVVLKATCMHIANDRVVYMVCRHIRMYEVLERAWVFS